MSLVRLTLFVALATQPVHERIGVNIHFTGAPARDLDLLQESGFGWVRMDFFWQSVEREKGRYDFAAYDQLVDGLAKRGMRALFILDYSNPIYESDPSVRTAEGRAAFARFAAAAAARYRGRGVCWEIWNEPNLKQFWSPQPADQDYLALVQHVVPAMRKADSHVQVLAPGTSRFPWPMLEHLFAGGLLEQVDAVSVHPYRSEPPETAAPDYRRLRQLIKQYTPADQPALPIVSSEWGYSNTHWGKSVSRELQATYLVRQLLGNIAEGIPLSIWYDWCNDGRDAKNTEHNFGTVTADRTPKPAFLAVKTLNQMIGPMVFQERIGGPAGCHLLVFQSRKTDRRVLVTWTDRDDGDLTAEITGHELTVTVTELAGSKRQVKTQRGICRLPLGPSPIYLELATDSEIHVARFWPAWGKAKLWRVRPRQ